MKDPESHTTGKGRAAGVAENTLQQGLMLLAAGQYGNMIQTLMPLSITDDDLEESLSILARAVTGTT